MERQHAYKLGIEKYEKERLSAQKALTEAGSDYDRIIAIETIEEKNLRITQNQRRLDVLIEGKTLSVDDIMVGE